jgi:hypothetical protein
MIQDLPSVAIAARAEKWPHIPWTPPEGGVLAEHRKTRGSGVE